MMSGSSLTLKINDLQQFRVQLAVPMGQQRPTSKVKATDSGSIVAATAHAVVQPRMHAPIGSNKYGQFNIDWSSS
jgi:hypothetical protein